MAPRYRPAVAPPLPPGGGGGQAHSEQLRGTSLSRWRRCLHGDPLLRLQELLEVLAPPLPPPSDVFGVGLHELLPHRLVAVVHAARLHERLVGFELRREDATAGDLGQDALADHAAVALGAALVVAAGPADGHSLAEGWFSIAVGLID